MAHTDVVSLILASLRLSCGVVAACDLDLGTLTLVTVVVDQLDFESLAELGEVLEGGQVRGWIAGRRFFLGVCQV